MYCDRKVSAFSRHCHARPPELHGDTGTAATPITISSYSTGSAWVSSGTASGLFGYNVSGITVTNLYFLGNGSTNTKSGVSFYTDAAGGAEGIQIASVEVSGYGKNGIEVGSWNTTNGYRHVKVKTSTTHYNTNSGLVVYAQYPNVHQDIYVGQVTAAYNPGIAGGTQPSGNGITFGGVSGGTIESSQAYENGRLCDASTGPVGIWTYDSTNVMIQNNTSYHNRTAKADGDGFDLDQNVSYSTLQHNVSYENDGAGYLLAQGPANSNHTGNIVQYNTSSNDSRKLSYGGILAWGRILNATIRNNTISMSPRANALKR